MVVVGGSHRHASWIVIRSPPCSPQLDTNSDSSEDFEDTDPTYNQEEIGPSPLPDTPFGT
jgi:hypothetical protein